MMKHSEKSKEELLQEITELKQQLVEPRSIGNKFEGNEEKHLSLFDNTHDLIQKIDNEGNILYVNKAWKEKLGYIKEGTIKKLNLFQIIHPDSLEHCKEVFEKLLIGKNAQNISATFITKSGNKIIIEGNVSPILKNEEIVSTLGFFRDVTERIKTEEKLELSLSEIQKSLTKLNSAQQIAKIGSWELDFISNTLTWSNEVYRLFGLQPQRFESTYESFLDHIHPEDREMVNKAFTDSLKDKKPYQIEHRVLLKDGTVKYVQERCNTLFNDEGNPVYSHGTIMDISETKQKIKIIEDYKYALDQSSIVAITNHKGVIIFVNDKFCDISKYSKKELIGQDHRILKSGHHSKEFIKDLWKTIASGKVWRGEIKNKAKDGTLYWVDTTIVPFLNKKGKPFQYIAIRTEISERKNLDIALKKEKELSELKSKFVTMTSHEFRTPLAAITFAAGSVKKYWERLDVDSRIQKLDKIENQVNHMTGLLDDILVIGQTESGKTASNFELFNFNKLIEPIIDEVCILSKNTHEITLLNKNSDVTILIDQKLGRNIFINLLNNAIKFSPEKKEVILEVINFDDKMIQIKIIDFGIGIKKENIENIFTPFYREENAESIQGTGLGLSIVKDAVRLSKGTINVESTIDKGTTFIINLLKK